MNKIFKDTNKKILSLKEKERLRKLEEECSIMITNSNNEGFESKMLKSGLLVNVYYREYNNIHYKVYQIPNYYKDNNEMIDYFYLEKV